MSTFNGKVALVTGAGSGIGRATAELLASRGAALSLTDINADALAQTQTSCARHSVTVLTTACDVTKRADLERLVQRTIDKFGRLDILLPIAGGGLMPDRITSDIASFDRVINLNLRSVIELTQLCIPHLGRTQGNIVNVGSISGIRAYPDAAFYGISKAGVNHLTRLLAAELAGKKVRVNVVNPGIVRTNIFTNSTAHLAPEKKTEFGTREAIDYWLDTTGSQMNLFGRVAEAGEVAAAIAFLASDDAAFITGEQLLIDAGNTLISSTHLRRALSHKL